MTKIRCKIEAIQSVLSYDLLSPEWRKRYDSRDHPTAGHCYVGAEALYHLLGKEGWQPMVASYRDDENRRATHWYLVNKVTGAIADPTAEQYLPGKPPYRLGRKAGFLTTQPSRRAAKVLDRVKSLLSRSI